MSISMWDTIAPRDLVGRIPSAPRGEAVAGYVQGSNSWPDYGLLCQLFPNAYHLSIGGRFARGRCIDVETGFADISQLDGWLNTYDEKAEGGPPVVYGSASTVRDLRGVIGGRNVLIWSAHYNFHPHVCGPDVCGYPGAELTQWTDVALPGGDADQSLVPHPELVWPGGKPPVPPDPHRLLMFASHQHPNGLQGGPFPSPYGDLDERDTVMRYYGAYGHKQWEGYMPRLRAELLWLAHRLDRVAIILDPNPDKTPSWEKDFRGPRHERVAAMGEGGKPQ